MRGSDEDQEPFGAAGELAGARSMASSTTMPPNRPPSQLGGDHAVVVRVVPAQRRPVIGGELVGVRVGLPGIDLDEDVVAVALRRDVEAVGVQVGRLVEVVLEGDDQGVAGADPQRRARRRAVVGVGEPFAVAVGDRAVAARSVTSSRPSAAASTSGSMNAAPGGAGAGAPPSPVWLPHAATAAREAPVPPARRSCRRDQERAGSVGRCTMVDLLLRSGRRVRCRRTGRGAPPLPTEPTPPVAPGRIGVLGDASSSFACSPRLTGPGLRQPRAGGVSRTCGPPPPARTRR